VLTDYPKDKIEWVIVDDSNDPEQSVSDKVAQFAKRAPVAQVVYVPLPRKHSIGYKRNLGVERATNKIILCMDDDDHYPETSFRRRVAWLTKHPWHPKVVACSTIACYDLVKGVSAVNTPPWELGPSQRISEATLTFYKSFWEQRKFPQVNMAEGEEFLRGRESSLIDMPPQQILVAFSHQGNSSGRRIPTTEDTKPGCFWGFPKEYLIWIHKLAGIEVEEEKEVKNRVKKR
jgi:glycosyltransferase involved in cell wall biosynthesis